MNDLLQEIRRCTICKAHLILGPNPIISGHPDSKIAIIGQAPGSIVHRTGKPWDDKSGQRLREWLGVDEAGFYNPVNFAIVPMGFCYPGSGKSGDLPPRKECAPQWHTALLNKMEKLQLTILIGSYAQAYYLKGNQQKNLTETVRSYASYFPEYFVLPHPSPRNNIWMKKNPWFAEHTLPALRQSIEAILKL